MLQMIPVGRPSNDKPKLPTATQDASAPMSSLDEQDLSKAGLTEEVPMKSEEEMDLNNPPTEIKPQEGYDTTEKRDNDTNNDMKSSVAGIFGSDSPPDEDLDEEVAQIEAQGITALPQARTETNEVTPPHWSTTASSLSQLLSALGPNKEYTYLIFNSMTQPPPYVGGYSPAQTPLVVRHCHFLPSTPQRNYTWRPEGTTSTCYDTPACTPSVATHQDEARPSEAWSTQHCGDDDDDDDGNRIFPAGEDETVGAVQLEQYLSALAAEDITHAEILERHHWTTPRRAGPRL